MFSFLCRQKLHISALSGGCCVLLLLTACHATFPTETDEGIGFREERHAEITAMQNYRECLDEAAILDSKARQAGSHARYLASARMMEKCEAGLGPESSGLAVEERMKSYALSIQNYFKGGDVIKARANLNKFKAAYSDHDLYYSDGASFSDTMSLLLGLENDSALGEFSTVNVNPMLKTELRRIRYWQRN